MNLLNQLTIKNLKLNKKRTIVTIIGIILSVSLITAVASMYVSGIASIIKYEITQKGNFHVAYYHVPVDDLFVFHNNRGIADVNVTQDIGYAKIASKNTYKPYAFIKAFTKSALNNLSIKLIQGRLPENATEIIIPSHLKTNGRLVLNIGDTITLDVGKRMSLDNYELFQNNPFQEETSEKIVDTNSKTYKIVGIIERPATNIESFSAPGYTFITYMDEANLAGYVDVFARYTKEGTKNAYSLTADILGINRDLFVRANTHGDVSYDEYDRELAKAKYDININTYLINLETNPISNSGIAGLGTVLTIVIGIIIFTSIVCIKNSFDISITEKIKQYGMLKSIGATKKQIRKNVLYEAAILGFIGIPLGILCGFLASFFLVLISNYYFKSISEGAIDLEFHFSWLALVVALLLGIITIYFSARKSARKAAKIAPIDAIRNSADIKINPRHLHSPKIIAKIFGIGGVVSMKNLKRNKRKYRTTVFSIITSVFVFIGLSSFMNMAYKEIREEINYTEYNLVLSTSAVNNTNLKNFVNTTTFDNIVTSSIVRYEWIEIVHAKYTSEYQNLLNSDSDDEESIYFYAVGTDQYKRYLKMLGLTYEDMKDKAILYDYYENIAVYDKNNNIYKQKKVKVFDYQVGDTMSGRLKKSDNYTLKIGAISDKLPFGLQTSNDKILIISDELFDELADTTTLQIYYQSNNASKLQDEIEAYLGNEIYILNNTEESVKTMKNLLTLVGIFLYGFIIVVSLIGITNIFNTITTNMELRRREFAMLRSIGMTKKEFYRLIRLESLFIGFKALIIGIPIGVLISYGIYKAFNETGYDLPILAIIISIITVFFLIIIIMQYSINKINKQNIIDVIRNENI